MTFDLKFYWKLLLQRLPVMTALFLLASGIGLAMAYRLPAVYQTSARLLAEGAQLPGNLVTSTVQIDAAEELEVIRQQLLTRANMLDIARDKRALEDLGSMSADTIVDEMRNRTNIRSSGGRRNEPLILTVSFRARSGRIAADVVNEYVTRILAANAGTREEIAGGTREFFEDEVERLSNELDERSARITVFQAENSDALPSNLPYSLTRQAQLQAAISEGRQELTSLLEQKERISAAFAESGRLTAAETGGNVTRLTPEEAQLRALENELADALSVFSESNPRVVQLRARIDQQRARVAAGGAETVISDETRDPQQALFELQIAQIDAQVDTLERRIASAEADLEDVQDVIGRTPANDVALQGLQRDYDAIRREYDEAVRDLAQARTGERIEVTARGQRIRLIEAANVPSRPSSPNRPLIAAMGAAAGLGLAAGFFLLMELMNRAIRRPAELTRNLNIVPLATIPYIESRARRMMRRTIQATSFAAVLVGVPALLWAVDTYYLPLDLLFERLMERVGLA